MLSTNTSEADSAVTVEGYSYETPRSPWRVLTVEPLDNFGLRVSFRDGLTGLVWMKDLIFSEKGGIFRALSDPQLFAHAAVVFGAVTWPTGQDLAPDAMYDEIQRNGVWVLR